MSKYIVLFYLILKVFILYNYGKHIDTKAVSG